MTRARGIIAPGSRPPARLVLAPCVVVAEADVEAVGAVPGPRVVHANHRGEVVPRRRLLHHAHRATAVLVGHEDLDVVARQPTVREVRPNVPDRLAAERAVVDAIALNAN